jgi:DNA polymerase-3 subunit beta
MEITFQQSDFLREISLAVGAVERKTTIPILSALLIESGDKFARISSTDLEQVFVAEIPATITKGGATAIPARRLLDYVRLLPDGEVSLKTLPSQWTTVSAGRSKSRIAGIASETFPEIPKVEEFYGRTSFVDLKAAIERVIFAVSTEESRFVLEAALLEFGETARLVATDGHRLAIAEWRPTLVVQAGKFLIPRKALVNLNRFGSVLSGTTELRISADHNNLCFEADERRLLARRTAGNFPDYTRALPTKFEGKATVNSDELRIALQRSRLFGDATTHAVKLTLGDGSLSIEGKSAEVGDTEETITCSVEGPKVSAGFNANYLLEFLGATKSPETVIRYTDSNSAIEISPAEGDFRTIIMPMRL